MNKKDEKQILENLRTTSAIAAVAALVIGFFWLGIAPTERQSASTNNDIATSTVIQEATSTMPMYPEGWVKYNGIIKHVFFHSLVIDPELAFNDPKRGKSYKEYMITRDQFRRILDELYKNKFVLVDLTSLYTVNLDGSVSPKTLYLPKDKKPLILSIDDLNYYPYMEGKGFADKLVLDANNNIATEVPLPNGKKVVTRDGDVVPILDDFVKLHPDFSVGGTKGIIAETGFAGVLGYRTQSSNTINRQSEIEAVKPVIKRLKETGWKFASHSYSHEPDFQSGNISMDELNKDMQQWQDEVGTLVGPTDIYIGPFGQVFKPKDPRRQALIDHGFKMLCGVGMDLYFRYFSNYVMMDRANIDGIRLFTTPGMLSGYFDVKKIEDPGL